MLRLQCYLTKLTRHDLIGRNLTLAVIRSGVDYIAGFQTGRQRSALLTQHHLAIGAWVRRTAQIRAQCSTRINRKTETAVLCAGTACLAPQFAVQQRAFTRFNVDRPGVAGDLGRLIRGRLRATLQHIHRATGTGNIHQRTGFTHHVTFVRGNRDLPSVEDFALTQPLVIH